MQTTAIKIKRLFSSQNTGLLTGVTRLGILQRARESFFVRVRLNSIRNDLRHLILRRHLSYLRRRPRTEVVSSLESFLPSIHVHRRKLADVRALHEQVQR